MRFVRILSLHDDLRRHHRWELEGRVTPCRNAGASEFFGCFGRETEATPRLTRHAARDTIRDATPRARGAVQQLPPWENLPPLQKEAFLRERASSDGGFSFSWRSRYRLVSRLEVGCFFFSSAL